MAWKTSATGQCGQSPQFCLQRTRKPTHWGVHGDRPIRRQVRLYRHQTLVAQLSYHVVVRLLQHVQVSEVERAEVVDHARRLGLSSTARSSRLPQRIRRARFLAAQLLPQSSEIRLGIFRTSERSVEQLRRAPRIKVLRVFRVAGLRYEAHFACEQVVPIDVAQERMRLDLLCTLSA